MKLRSGSIIKTKMSNLSGSESEVEEMITEVVN